MNAPSYDDMLTQAKRPPHNIEAEQSVLGGIMLDATGWDRVVDVVTEDDFYRKDHRLIFRAIAASIAKNDPVDVITLSEYLERSNELENAGGLSFLLMLANNTPSAANIRSYAEIVRERSILRRLIAMGIRITESAFDMLPAPEIVGEAERELTALVTHRRTSKPVMVRDDLLTFVDDLDARFCSDQQFTGLSTGYEAIDNRLSGMNAGDLIIIAGRPGMGKTTLAMNIAENVVLDRDDAVLVFSMEMPRKQLINRSVSSIGKVPFERIRTGKLISEDWPRITAAVGRLKGTKLIIDDTGGLSPSELQARARQENRQHKLALIVIDYLQLMRVPGFKGNRADEISEISRSIKALAKELDIPIIALSQLNRNLEQRPNKRPVMSDLRESGAIEQDADVIIFVYRDEVYNKESASKGVAEIITGKQRNGPIGTDKLTFLGHYTRFENYIEEQHHSMPKRVGYENGFQ